MGNGRERLAATFVPIDVRRADVRRETVICGTGLGTTFVLRLWALGRGLWALRGALRAALFCNRSRCSLASEAGIKYNRRVATPGSHHPSLITHHPLENAAKKILAKKFEKS